MKRFMGFLVHLCTNQRKEKEMNYPETMKEYNDGKKRMLPIIVSRFGPDWFTLKDFCSVGIEQEREENHHLTTPEHYLPFNESRPLHSFKEGGHNFFHWRDRVLRWLRKEVKAERLETEMALINSRWMRVYKRRKNSRP